MEHDVVRRLGEFVTGAPVTPAVLESAREVLATGHGPFPFARQAADGQADD